MSTGPREAGAFDAAAIEALRLILKPKRERYDLGFTMNRWAVIVRDDIRLRDQPSQDTAPPIENLEPLVADLLGAPLDKIPLDEDDPAPARERRPRVDLERWAALCSIRARKSEMVCYSLVEIDY
jgi:hypothetical protein